MRIVTKTGEFDLPQNFQVEITLCNPVLSSIGEQSVPFDLPKTVNNLSLINFSNRLDDFFQPMDYLQVQIMEDTICRTCRMQINAIDKTISVTLYFNDAEFYSKIEDLKLPDIPWNVIAIDDYENRTHDERVQFLIDLLKNLHKEPNSADYSQILAVVPVATNQEILDKTGYSDNADDNLAFDILNNCNFLILNEFARPTTQAFIEEEYSVGWGTSTRYVFLNFQSEQERTLELNGNKFTVDKGYGMTPFLKVNYVLKHIFEYFGYSFNASLSQTDIVLNNVADAILDGKIYFSQLVPNMTIKEFMTKIEKTYAIRLVLDEVDKKVNIVHIASSFGTAKKDLTSRLCGSPKKSFPKFQELVLQRNNKHTSKKTTDISNQKKKSKKQISIDSLAETMKVQQLYMFSDSDYYFLSYDVQRVENIAHLNSSIIQDGKTVKEEQSSMTELRICGIGTNMPYSEEIDNPYNTLSLNLSIPSSMEQKGTFGNVDKLDLAYQEYGQFIEHSNISINVDMILPFSELLNLDITEPFLLLGQKMIFEKITYTLGSQKNICKVVLRTCDFYEQRE